MTSTAPDYTRFVLALMKRENLAGALYDHYFAPQIRITSLRGFGPKRDSLRLTEDPLQISLGLGIGRLCSRYGMA